MKKILLIVLALGTTGIINAQISKKKKNKKFVETYMVTTMNASSPQTQLLWNQYYTDTKNLIFREQSQLGEDKVNDLLIYNQEEFYKAIHNDYNRPNMTKQEFEAVKTMYQSTLRPNLDEYKAKVTEKLKQALNS